MPMDNVLDSIAVANILWFFCRSSKKRQKIVLVRDCSQKNIEEILERGKLCKKKKSENKQEDDGIKIFGNRKLKCKKTIAKSSLCLVVCWKDFHMSSAWPCACNM